MRLAMAISPSRENSSIAEHGEHLLDLLGIDLLGGQYRVDLVVGDVAAFLGVADELLDGSVGQIQQRQRGIRGLGTVLLRGFTLFRRRGLLGCDFHLGRD